MILQTCPIEGLLVAQPKIFGDNRGYFTEAFKTSFWETKTGTRFIQDNESFSSYGVIRGMHFQREPYAQAKLIRVLQGVIMDVVVDLRSHSTSYGKSFQVVLSSENKKQFYIPKGFAHGFCVLSPQALILYKIDEIYSPASEAGIRYNDPALDIQWPIREADAILSDKDLNAPLLKDLIL